MDRVERFWLGVSNALSGFVVDRIEAGRAADAGLSLPAYRRKVYGDEGGSFALIQRGEKVSVPAVVRRQRAASAEQFDPPIVEHDDELGRILMGPDTPMRDAYVPPLVVDPLRF